jgi:LacI family transcriptional regulator
MSTAKYAAIAAQLADRIRNMPPGTRCPGIAEISAEWSVARATAEKVLRHLADQGYVYRVVGSGTFVADRRVARIAVMLYSPQPSGTMQSGYAWDYHLRVAELLVDHIRNMGHEPQMLGSTDGVPDLPALQGLQPALCIVIGAPQISFVENLIRHGHAAIAVNTIRLGFPADLVQSEYIRRGYMAARAFIDSGFTDIHYVGLQQGYDGKNPSLPLRTAGFVEACESAGLDWRPRMHLAPSAKEASDNARRLLWLDRPPQAIIAMDDRMGSLVNTLARRIGLRVPTDLSVLAESGLPYSRVTCLATLPEHMASTAADFVSRRLASPSLPPQTALVSPVLVDRGTAVASASRLLAEAMSQGTTASV